MKGSSHISPSSCGLFILTRGNFMANKNYYYLKLKEDFFDGDELKILESMENGYLYSNILLKMYLKALKNDGKLTFNEFIPYDIKMLATITGHNVDVVEKAIKIFQGMHLIDILDNGAIYMLNMQAMIGSISSEGIRKAQYREKIRLEKESGTKLGQCPDIISISNSISNSNYNNEEKGVEKETKHKYGEYKHVLLTDKQLEKLKKDYGEDKTNTAIKFFDEYIQEKGYKCKDHNLAMRRWVFTAIEEKRVKNQNFKGRQYTREELNSVFQNIDDVET